MPNRLGFSWRNFWHSLAAVLLGNAVYFGLDGYLPPAGRHVAYKMDWGLAVDFWCCLVFYGVIDWALKRTRGRSSQR